MGDEAELDPADGEAGHHRGRTPQRPLTLHVMLDGVAGTPSSTPSEMRSSRSGRPVGESPSTTERHVEG